MLPTGTAVSVPELVVIHQHVMLNPGVHSILHTPTERGIKAVSLFIVIHSVLMQGTF